MGEVFGEIQFANREVWVCRTCKLMKAKRFAKSFWGTVHFCCFFLRDGQGHSKWLAMRGDKVHCYEWYLAIQWPVTEKTYVLACFWRESGLCCACVLLMLWLCKFPEASCRGNIHVCRCILMGVLIATSLCQTIFKFKLWKFIWLLRLQFDPQTVLQVFPWQNQPKLCQVLLRWHCWNSLFFFAPLQTG